LAVVAGLIGALAGPVPAAAALLLVYNPPEIYLRWRSLVRGLEGETRILADLGRGGISKIGQVLSRLLGLGVGCVAGLVLAPLIAAGRYQDALGGAFGVLVSIWLFRRRMDPIKVAPVAALAMGAAWLLFEGILLRRGGWLLAAVCLD
jgi:hypothetical protein